MLPAVTALGFASPSGVVGWSVRHGVDPLLIGSVLHRLNAGGGVPPSFPSFSGGGNHKLAWRERSEGKSPRRSCRRSPGRLCFASRVPTLWRGFPVQGFPRSWFVPEGLHASLRGGTRIRLAVWRCRLVRPSRGRSPPHWFGPSSGESLRHLCRAHAHSGSFPRLLWPLLTSRPLTAAGSPQVIARCSTALPPNLPPQAYHPPSVCCATSTRRVGLLFGSCPSARGFLLAFLPRVGYPSRVGFRWWFLHFHVLVFPQGT